MLIQLKYVASMPAIWQNMAITVSNVAWQLQIYNLLPNSFLRNVNRWAWQFTPALSQFSIRGKSDQLERSGF